MSTIVNLILIIVFILVLIYGIVFLVLYINGINSFNKEPDKRKFSYKIDAREIQGTYAYLYLSVKLSTGIWKELSYSYVAFENEEDLQKLGQGMIDEYIKKHQGRIMSDHEVLIRKEEEGEKTEKEKI